MILTLGVLAMILWMPLLTDGHLVSSHAAYSLRLAVKVSDNFQHLMTIIKHHIFQHTYFLATIDPKGGVGHMNEMKLGGLCHRVYTHHKVYYQFPHSAA